MTKDTKLNFKNHVRSLCKKTQQKLHVFTRIATYMDLNKRKCLVNAFVISHFNYYPLTWSFHNRGLNNCINR